MIKHLLLLFVVVSIVELSIILKIKKTVLELIDQIKKLPKMFKLSNQNEKYEKWYFDLSKNIFFSSLKILFFFLFLLISFLILYRINQTSILYLLSIIGIIETFLIFIIYLVIRKKISL